uniref:Uncharacterized protein n=1 Tax=Anguilla anguilla TaxID=7936 RepID=A0A0E9UPZ2_ANGAN
MANWTAVLDLDWSVEQISHVSTNEQARL